MQLTDEVHRWRGVIPSRAMIEAGYSYRQLRTLCSSGELRRVRQGWLATREADPLLVRAARVGGVLTCVTQARRLKLWVTEADSRAHLGLRPSGKRPQGGDLCLHWNAPLVPRDPRQLEDGLVNVLATIAICLSTEDAQAVWESALNRQLIELPELQRLPFSGRARQLLQVVQPFSDSGLETMVSRRLRRLRVRVSAQSWILGHCVDFLIGDRLVLQIDGGTHVGAQRTQDIGHDARLMLNGYHVIRVGYEQVVHRWHEVQDLIMRAVAQGLANV